MINPGSISQSRSMMEETYAELLVDSQNVTLNFRNRNHDIIETVEFKVNG